MNNGRLSIAAHRSILRRMIEIALSINGIVGLCGWGAMMLYPVHAQSNQLDRIERQAIERERVQIVVDENKVLEGRIRDQQTQIQGLSERVTLIQGFGAGFACLSAIIGCLMFFRDYKQTRS